MDFDRVGTGVYAGSYLHQHVVALHHDRVRGNLRGAIMCGFAGLRIVLPPVPWTDDLPAFHNTLAQWPAAVQANVVHCAESSFAVGDADRLLSNCKLPRFAIRRKFAFRSNADESWHLETCKPFLLVMWSKV